MPRLNNPADFALAIHGGAGTITPGSADEAPYHTALHGALAAGQTILAAGGTALDAVVAAVTALEDAPQFNAGFGAVFTTDATHELDAAVMEGTKLAAGAVAGVQRVRNPVQLARLVMGSGSVMLSGAGAERFAREQGIALVEPDYFSTAARREQLEYVQARTQGAVLDHNALSKAIAPLDERSKLGTVGAVARDRHGHLAAAGSTGGMTNKRVGRIGDTAVIGAGVYANDATCAIAATGTGEAFLRACVGHDIHARMLYAGKTLEEACQTVIFEQLPRVDGTGGVVAVDRDGRIQMVFNSSGMYRGWVTSNSPAQTAIYR